jgi:hypothetical protein
MEEDLAYVRNNDRIYISKGKIFYIQVRSSIMRGILVSMSC